jgi:hypothetical protein
MMVMKRSRAAAGYVLSQAMQAHPYFAVDALDSQIIGITLAKQRTFS